MIPPIVYIAGPYRGPDNWTISRNIDRARCMARAVALVGAMPLCPHTNTNIEFHGTGSDDFWLAGTLELLRRCDAVMLIPYWEQSTGARAEYAEAVRRAIPTFSTVDALADWVRRRKQS